MPDEAEIVVVDREEFTALAKEGFSASELPEDLIADFTDQIDEMENLVLVVVISEDPVENMNIIFCEIPGGRVKASDLIDSYSELGVASEIHSESVVYGRENYAVVVPQYFPELVTHQVVLHDDNCNSILTYTTEGSSDLQTLKTFVKLLTIR